MPDQGPAGPEGGFIVQMVRGELGCLDTVNLQRFGIDYRAFSNLCARKQGPAQYRALLARDVRFESAVLWAGWCVAVAARDGFEAERLSLAHVRFVQSGRTGLS